jgi:hypothetical protein
MKTVAIFAIFAIVCFAQGPVVNQTSGPPPEATQNLFYYDANNNLQYNCRAPQRQSPTTYTRSASSLTSIAVSSNTATMTTAAAHGLYIGAIVTVTGASVVPALNGTYKVLTVPSSTTLTFTTSGVGNATYNEATLVVTTTYPLTTANRWAIQVFTYDATTNSITGSYWANTSVGYGLACTNRTSY